MKNLQRMGVVHKSNQSEIFFICNRDIKDKHNLALIVCKKCKKTEEINLNSFSKIFQNLKTKKKYDFSNFEMEISTLCKSVLDYEKFIRFKEKKQD